MSLLETGQGQPEVRYCAAHPTVETGLTCGRCGTPICPRCLVQTPVGARCRECARLRRLPIFEVSPLQYAQAAAVAAGVALALGILWSLLPLRGYGTFVAAAAVGFLIGEAVSRAVNRKRSTGLKVIAGLAVPGAFLVSLLFPLALRFGLAGALALAPGLVVAPLASPLVLLALALGVYLAVLRIDR
ncbi:MAG: hypothetical protein HY689_13625 [Chloroflexi bacterium]|nr:hypothetical protein [Chloroflexota bacterium]